MANYYGNTYDSLQAAKTADNALQMQRVLAMILAESRRDTERTNRAGQSKDERVANRVADNDAERIRSAMANSQSQRDADQLRQMMHDSSSEAVAFDRTLADQISELTRTGSAEEIARLNRAQQNDIANRELELRKLPFSPESRAHELEVARLGIRPDPRLVQDAARENALIRESNFEAEGVAKLANSKLDPITKQHDINFNNSWWTKDGTWNKRYADDVTGIHSGLGEQGSLVTFDAAARKFVPRVRNEVPIPENYLAPRQNRPAMDGSISVPIAPRVEPAWDAQSAPPIGRVAIPIAPRPSGGATGSWGVPVGVPVAPSRVFTSEAEARAAGIAPGQEFILIQNGERWRARLR